MMDIYILENNDSSYEELKNICVSYLIRKNYDVQVRRYKGNIVDSASIYMLRFDDKTEELSRMVRNINRGSYVVVLVDDISKIKCAVTPGICPSGVVIKPWDKEDISIVLDEIYNDSIRIDVNNRSGSFSFKIKAKEYSVSYDRILYFESQNKKIIVRTETQEFEYYDTLDSILNKTPDVFLKIHKSFVVNLSRIASVNYSMMTVEFDDGSRALISRTYKAQLKTRLEMRGDC